MVRSELSHGDYVRTDDDLSLPNYLTHLPSHNYVIIYTDVVEGFNERVNGGDYNDDS